VWLTTKEGERMSGHSKWASIKRAKGKNDAARGKLFNRLIREITVAAKMGGADPEANNRLRAAISNAKSNNMPNKNIESAIQKGTGKSDGAALEEITFEGYGPQGVAVLVESLTDNRNRTVAAVRHVLTKAGGNMGSTNSVNWMFHIKGIIAVERSATDEEALLEVALEAGAEDMKTSDDEYEITTTFEKFETVRAAIEKAGISMASAELTKVPESTVQVEGEAAEKVLRLIDALDDLEDTQHVYSNFEISDEEMEKIGQ
jgi:YebC/PmpR family DNA-binding regulatory protein